MTVSTGCLRSGLPRIRQRSRSVGAHPHRLARFTAVGGAATALQLGLFALLQALVPVFWANVLAWGASTVVGNQVHRTLTFGRHGREGARQDFAVSIGFSALSLATTTLALAPVEDDRPGVALIVLIVVNTVVGLARFLGLRRWFAGHGAPSLTA
jgi:putative flippase GtrA